jgi:MFS family permease
MVRSVQPCRVDSGAPVALAWHTTSEPPAIASIPASPRPAPREPAAQEPWNTVGSGQRAWLVVVLTLLLILSFLDRNILKLLVDPLRHDLGITDLQVSLLVGLSFSILYSLSCIPFGHAADRHSRRSLIGGAVFLWSCMSMCCGLAGNYWQLFAARAGLGIGEAALQPNAVSLIRDSFPPDGRARAFSIFGIGPLVGSAFAMLIGGALFAAAEAGAFDGVPLLGGLRPWQIALVIPGMAGVVLALLAFTLREPPRPPRGGASGPTFRDLFAHMGQRRRLHLLLFAGPTLWSLANSGWSAWMAAGIGRTWGLSPGEIGATAGLIGLVCTPIGLISLGFLIDRLTRRGNRDAIFHVTFAVQALHMLPAMAIFLAPSVEMMWIAYAAAALIASTVQILGSAVLTEVTPSHLVGKAAALYNMVQNFLGLAIGPTIFALAATGFSGERAIVPAMMLCYALFIALASGVIALLMHERHRLRDTEGHVDG